MGKLSLVPREIVDLGGMEARLAEDIANGINPEYSAETHKDLGLVEWEGHEYYGFVYWPKITKEDLIED